MDGVCANRLLSLTDDWVAVTSQSLKREAVVPEEFRLVELVQVVNIVVSAKGCEFGGKEEG